MYVINLHQQSQDIVNIPVVSFSNHCIMNL